MKKIILLVQAAAILSCSKNEKLPTVIENNTDTAVAISPTPPHSDVQTQNLKDINREILQILKQKNYRALADFIHPQKGVRFSMYSYVDPKKDKVFTREDFLKYINSQIKFTWGHKDGSGDLYQTSLLNYLSEWVYKRDFSAGEYFENEIKGRGNTLVNISKVYPQAVFTENYIPGSEQYAFMDWNSLRLVFEKVENKYYLVAIVNDQWTV